jgi:hypothetical protein
MTALEQYAKEHEEELEKRYRKLYPLPSEERSKAILEASKSITLDDYNPDAQWTFKQGESPFEWYDAQVKAMNHFGHIFCINPFYDNFNKYTPDGRYLRPSDSPDVFYGWEFKSTEELIESLKKCGGGYLDMTIRTIKYLRANNGIEFPNGWGDQFPETA